MKLHILRGREGEVLATFYRPVDALVWCEPEVEEGCYVEEVDAPEDYQRDLEAFYRQHAKSAKQSKG